MKKALVIIFSAVTGLALVGGTIAVLNIFNNGQNEADKKQYDTESRDVSFYEPYIEKYFYSNNSDLNLFKDGLTQDAKLYILINNFEPVDYTHFTYDDINASYRKLFSGDLPKESIKNSRYCMPSYTFNERDEEYHVDYGLGGCGGIDPTPRYYGISKVIDYGERFVIQIAYGKGESNGDNGSEYRLELGNSKSTIIKCDYEECDDIFEPLYPKLKRYNFYFVEQDGNYVLADFKEHDGSSIDMDGAKVISYERHSEAWYKNNTKKQIIADDNFNVFDEKIDESLKRYIVLRMHSSFAPSYDYLSIDDIYFSLYGEHLKKEAYKINDCYDLEYMTEKEYYGENYFFDGGDAGLFKNKSIGQNHAEWTKNCSDKRTNMYRYSEIKNIKEKEGGYVATVKYADAILNTDEKTSEVEYRLNKKDGVEIFKCGYDKGSCKIEKIEEYIKENPDSFHDYEIYFKTNGEAEVIEKVTKK